MVYGTCDLQRVGCNLSVDSFHNTQTAVALDVPVWRGGTLLERGTRATRSDELFHLVLLGWVVWFDMGFDDNSTPLIGLPCSTMWSFYFIFF
jgi:hypothetical protein